MLIVDTYYILYSWLMINQSTGLGARDAMASSKLSCFQAAQLDSYVSEKAEPIIESLQCSFLNSPVNIFLGQHVLVCDLLIALVATAWNMLLQFLPVATNLFTPGCEPGREEVLCEVLYC